jgi:hypothetical protein
VTPNEFGDYSFDITVQYKRENQAEKNINNYNKLKRPVDSVVVTQTAKVTLAVLNCYGANFNLDTFLIEFLKEVCGNRYYNLNEASFETGLEP